ncbi:MAG: helicase-related protein [Candidatus Hodarchaeota archaeon]
MPGITEESEYNLEQGYILEPDGVHISEQVCIDQTEKLGNTIHVIGHKIESGERWTIYLPLTQIPTLKIKKTIQNSFLGSGLNFQLGIRGLWINLARYRGERFALQTTSIDSLPYQIEAVYLKILPTVPIRFMLADEAGAGKTIMAGLVFSELKARQLASRLLIIVPRILVEKWQNDFLIFFNEKLDFITGSDVRNKSFSIWNPGYPYQCIMSMDTAKQEEIRDLLKAVHWDLIIIDEAHKLSATFRYEKGFQTLDATERYRLGQVLSNTTSQLLLLTATPHKGDPDAFRLIFNLLDEAIAIDEASLEKEIKKDGSSIFLRRLKEKMVRNDGSKIFTDRNARTLTFRLEKRSPKTHRLYHAVTNYVREYFGKAFQEDPSRRSAIGFAMTILQRRLASSTVAIYQSLRRREEKLRNYLEDDEAFLKAMKWLEKKDREKEGYEEEYEDSTDFDRVAIEDQALSTILEKNRLFLEQELMVLQKLILQTEEVLDTEIDPKYDLLIECLEEELKEDQKILIFTEYIDTLEFLEKSLHNTYKVTTISGKLTSMDSRYTRMNLFKKSVDQGGVQILIATDAAGEGIDLQFCNKMINYDIPWNPNRLEQRMGRIHRYGQQLPVVFINLATEDTREGLVLTRVLRKIEIIRQQMGNDKIFDVISAVISGKTISELMREALFSKKSTRNLAKDVDYITDNITPQTIKNAIKFNLTSSILTLEEHAAIDIELEDTRVTPEHARDFFIDAHKKLESRFTIYKDKSGIKFDRISHKIEKKLANLQELDSRLFFRKPEKALKSVENLRIILTPAHPLFQETLNAIERETSADLFQGAIFEDLEAIDPYLLYFCTITITNGLNLIIHKDLYCLKVNKSSVINVTANSRYSITLIGPSSIQDLIPRELPDSMDKTVNVENYSEISSIDKKFLQAYILDHVNQELLPKIAEKRQKKANEMLNSVKRFFGKKVANINKALVKLHREKKTDSLTQANIARRKIELSETLEQERLLKRKINQENTLAITDFREIGRCLVIPALIDTADEYKEALETKEIEQIAMNEAMNYEFMNGWQPVDVHADTSLGYDIRSTRIKDGRLEIKRIEVKGRKVGGGFLLTENEKKSAEKFRTDFWIYYVANCVTDPILKRLQDPISKLSFNNTWKVVRYKIDEEEFNKESQK